MIAIVIFVAATAAALLIGISVALRVMPLVVTRRSVRYVLLLGFVAVAMGLLSVGLMSTIETAIPANNSAQFKRQTSFGISQDEIAISFELICISRPLGGSVVQDHLDRRIGRVSSIEELEEFDKLAAAVTLLDQGVDLTSEQIDSGQQAECAMALILMIA